MQHSLRLNLASVVLCILSICCRCYSSDDSPNSVGRDGKLSRAPQEFHVPGLESNRPSAQAQGIEVIRHQE